MTTIPNYKHFTVRRYDFCPVEYQWDFYAQLQGVIFSLDLCVLAQSNQCNLVSAAEDRSIAVWTTVLKTVGDDDDDVTKFRGPWELLYRLDGGAPAGDVIFQSRIRMVVASSLGMLAVGEVSTFSFLTHSRQNHFFYVVHIS